MTHDARTMIPIMRQPLPTVMPPLPQWTPAVTGLTWTVSRKLARRLSVTGREWPVGSTL